MLTVVRLGGWHGTCSVGVSHRDIEGDMATPSERPARMDAGTAHFAGFVRPWWMGCVSYADLLPLSCVCLPFELQFPISVFLASSNSGRVYVAGSPVAAGSSNNPCDTVASSHMEQHVSRRPLPAQVVLHAGPLFMSDTVAMVRTVQLIRGNAQRVGNGVRR